MQLELVLLMDNRGLVELLQDGDHSNLDLIYTLCLRVGTDGHSFLRREFHKHVKEKGMVSSKPTRCLILLPPTDVCACISRAASLFQRW